MGCSIAHLCAQLQPFGCSFHSQEPCCRQDSFTCCTCKEPSMSDGARSAVALTGTAALAEERDVPVWVTAAWPLHHFSPEARTCSRHWDKDIPLLGKLSPKQPGQVRSASWTTRNKLHQRVSARNPSQWPMPPGFHREQTTNKSPVLRHPTHTKPSSCLRGCPLGSPPASNSLFNTQTLGQTKIASISGLNLDKQVSSFLGGLVRPQWKKHF